MLFIEPLIDKGELISFVLNICLTLYCIVFSVFMVARSHASLVRPAFMIAVLMIALYQVPLIFALDQFYHEKINLLWFAACIHAAVLGNLLWVNCTSGLNNHTIFMKPSDISADSTFSNYELYSSLAFFCILFGVYLYKVPPTCTALYAIFFDPSLALLVRELSVKLVGTNYSTYSLSILCSTVIPIFCFLTFNKIYHCIQMRKFIYLPIWLAIAALTFMTALVSGAKGNVIPTFITVSVAGFLCFYNWYFRIAAVVVLNSILILFLMFFSAQRPSIKASDEGGYPFASCVVKLHACNEVRELLSSLKSRDFSLDLTRDTILSLERDTQRACLETPPQPLITLQTKPASTSSPINIIKAPTLTQQNFTPKAPTHTQQNLTPNEELIVAELAKAKSIDRLYALIDRAFVIPLIVAHWHFLYVETYGKPGILGIAIARKFSKNYVDMPGKICEIYEYIRSHGDKTTTCTAPTSYLFTYPAYMGIWGLLLASFATILFDMIGALLIKFLSPPLNYLAVGLIAAAGINFMTADFTTVLVSHGAGAAFAILILFYFCRLIKQRPQLV